MLKPSELLFAFLVDFLHSKAIRNLHYPGYEYFISSNVELVSPVILHAKPLPNSLPGYLRGLYNANSPTWTAMKDSIENAECMKYDGNTSLKIQVDPSSFFGLGCYQSILKEELRSKNQYDIVMHIRIDRPINESLTRKHVALVQELLFEESLDEKSGARTAIGAGVFIGYRKSELELLLIGPFIDSHACISSEQINQNFV